MKALQRLHRKLSITVVDGVQQIIFQRVAVLQHLDAEDGLFRRHTLPWQIGRFGGKICVVYPVGAEGAAVELLPEGAPKTRAPCVLKSAAGTWYNYSNQNTVQWRDNI